MLAVKGIFNGKEFRSLEPVPVNKKYIVAITFLEPIEKDQSKLLDFSGIWDDEDINDIEAIIKERSNFTKGRDYEI